MTVTEARAIAREYDEAYRTMRAAWSRFTEADRAYRQLPMTFDAEPVR